MYRAESYTAFITRYLTTLQAIKHIIHCHKMHLNYQSQQRTDCLESVDSISGLKTSAEGFCGLDVQQSQTLKG